MPAIENFLDHAKTRVSLKKNSMASFVSFLIAETILGLIMIVLLNLKCLHFHPVPSYNVGFNLVSECECAPKVESKRTMRLYRLLWLMR